MSGADVETADLRSALVAGFRHRLRLAGNPAEATKWWADDLADLAVEQFARHTPAPDQQAIADRVAAVLAIHWSYESVPDYDAWLCECGARFADRDVDDTDVAMQAHVATVIAAALGASA